MGVRSIRSVSSYVLSTDGEGKAHQTSEDLCIDLLRKMELSSTNQRSAM